MYVLSVLPVNRKSIKKLFFKCEREQVNNIQYIYLPFINLPVLRHMFILCSATFFSFKYFFMKKHVVLVADVLSITAAGISLFMSKLCCIRSLGIVTDVPGIMNSAKGVKGWFIKKINLFILSLFNSYLFLTKQMNTLINKSGKPYIIIEGLVDHKMVHNTNNIIDKHKTLICHYAGGLQKSYGIKTLTEAFLKANIANTELHIYGTGDYLDELKQICKMQCTVKYQGVHSNDFIVKEQIKSTLMINPRPTTEVFTEYSFPSKNMEYMASGTPLLTTKLPGMPEEYNQYVYLLQNETSDGLAYELQAILSKSRNELHEKGMCSKRFVLREKSNIIQSQKVIDMLLELLGSGEKYEI
jgi:glycosyltransferase involved in cell wall biosynthesis